MKISAYFYHMIKVVQLCGICGVLSYVRVKLKKKFKYNYSKWVKTFDTLNIGRLNEFIKQIEQFEIKPVISIIMPVYNPHPEFLNQAIWSVRKQIYPYWELCIADDASTDWRIKKILEQHAQEESKIKIIYRKLNGHISSASNSALELASGEFIGFLDQDDLLAQHALFWIADTINKFKNSAIIYSDEDKIDKSGKKRQSPHFKPDFNYEMFLSVNMISHFGVYKRSLLNQINGFRVGYEGSQDHDLALRAIELIDHSQIVHIPKVLYHWRIHKNSTAQTIDAKLYARTASVRAVSDHLNRCHFNAQVTVDPNFPHINRVKFALLDVRPLISLIIPTRDKANLLTCCLNSIFEKTTYQNYEIIIIDNGSVEKETFELFNGFRNRYKHKFKILPDSQPFNYSSLNNHAVRHANGEYLCFLNNDIEILTDDWLEEMLSHAIRPNVGCVGARLWYPNGLLQHGGIVLGFEQSSNVHAHLAQGRGSPGYASRAVMLQNFSAVTAACMLIKKSIFQRVCGFDEKLAIDFNDVDLCLKVRAAGYRNVWTPYAEMIHHESASRGHPKKTKVGLQKFEYEKNIMNNRWKNELSYDPAYNPNLSIQSHQYAFSYAWPPRKPPQYEDCTFW